MYNDVPTTCFGPFLTGHYQVGIQCQRNYTSTLIIGTDISISVSTLSVLTLILMSILVAGISTRIVPLTLYTNLIMAS